jgi:hypothetical protein
MRHYAMKIHMAEWRYSSTFLDLDTRWRWVPSLTPRPIYPWERNPRYPLDRRLGSPQSLSGRYEEKTPVPAGNRTQAVHS